MIRENQARDGSYKTKDQNHKDESTTKYIGDINKRQAKEHRYKRKVQNVRYSDKSKKETMEEARGKISDERMAKICKKQNSQPKTLRTLKWTQSWISSSTK